VKKLFFMVFFGMAVLTLAMTVVAMAVGTGSDAPEPIPTLSPDMARRLWAYEQGNVLFEYNGGGEGYALCYGQTRIVWLKQGSDRSIELTAQESLNLSLCHWTAEQGKYQHVQDVSGASPGDKLTWDTGGVLRWSRYTQ